MKKHTHEVFPRLFEAKLVLPSNLANGGLTLWIITDLHKYTKSIDALNTHNDLIFPRLVDLVCATMLLFPTFITAL